MIPIFSFAYYLYSQTDLKIVEVLDKSFGVTAGLFGGAATLTAAYIASLLFNDWRDQHNKTVEKEMAWVVIQKFDAADLRLGQFQHNFENFKYKCNFLSEMPDNEIQNLDKELNIILSSIKGVSLELSSFLESVRKYSLIAENAYFENITNDVREINLRIFNLQNHRASFPSSMRGIENTITQFSQDVKQIEQKCINQILSELKALN